MAQLVVGFSKPKSWLEPFSWLIRLVTWSPVSHAYIKLSLGELDKKIIFQASGLVVNMIGEDLFDLKENIYKEFTLDIADAKHKEILQYAIDQLGQPYNFKGVLGMAVVRIGKLLGRKWNNPFGYNSSGAFCSELVAYILETYDNVSFADVADESPADVLAVMEQLTP